MAIRLAELEIILKARGIKTTKKELDKLKKELKSTGKQAKQTTTGFDKFKNGLKSFNPVALATALGIGAIVSKLTEFIKSSFRVATATEQIRRGFQDLTVNSTSFLKELDRVTKGTVTNFELMTAANRALLLGLEQNQLVDLFEKAAIVGQAAGRTVTEAIDDITTGIGRQSRLILDNLGIIVKAEDAQRKYAKSIGKTAQQLTENEKRLAFTSAAMESLTQKANSLGGELEETAIIMQSKFKKALNDLSEIIGKTFEPAVVSTTGALTKFIETTNIFLKGGKEFIKMQEGITKSEEEKEAIFKGIDDRRKARLDAQKESISATEDATKTSGKFINKLLEEVQLLNATTDAEKKRIQTNQIRNLLEKEFLKSVDLTNVSTKDRIIILGKLQEALQRITDANKNIISSSDEASDALDRLSLKTFGQIGQVGAGGLVGQGLVQGGTQFDVREGVFTEAEKEERRERGINTAPTTDENIGSNV